MPSFDIVSKVDAQALDNAVNVTSKEITNRFDFKGSHVVINLNKKDFKINIETEDEMKMRHDFSPSCVATVRPAHRIGAGRYGQGKARATLRPRGGAGRAGPPSARVPEPATGRQRTGVPLNDIRPSQGPDFIDIWWGG